MKQETFRFRTTAKRDEVDWARFESVHEIVPTQYTDESADPTSKVFVSIMLSVIL